MKPAFALLLLSLTPAWCQIAKPAALAGSSLPAPRAARIPSQAISELERAFNNRLVTMADVNEPVDLLGDTRGVQLDDYGVVFTSEVSLVITPAITPFLQKIGPELAARVHKRRVERMPILKAAMSEMMRNMAAKFTQIPASQQIVLVVRLYYGGWEDTTGMPAQVIMRADRASAAAGRIETEER
ncbi:MAG: hypothetical protein NTW28_28910 [Candidatus Solibacter sp.]|nr:hypothetical protein [Candidatus Solibacter sp.]